MKVNYFDLGCNQGETVARAIKQLREHDLTVYGIDANPDMIAVCKKRFAKNPNVFFHCLAVTSERCRVRLYQTNPKEDGKHLGNSIFGDKKNVNSSFVDVDGMPFSEFLSGLNLDGVNILKANIEGAEIHLVRDLHDKGLFGKFQLFLGSSREAGWEVDMLKIPSLAPFVGEMKEKMKGKKVLIYNHLVGVDLSVEVKRFQG